MDSARSKDCYALHATEIRSTLRESLRAWDDTAAFIDEMPLCRGEGRADLAEVNGALSGFEIKSGRDSLARLPIQIPLYDTIFDFCYAVVTRRHLTAVRAAIPPAWGIRLIEMDDRRPSIRTIRPAKRNYHTDIAAQIRLLWKPEAVRVLRAIGNPVSPTVSVVRMWEALRSAPKDVVAEYVRGALKTRARVAAQS